MADFDQAGWGIAAAIDGNAADGLGHLSRGRQAARGRLRAGKDDLGPRAARSLTFVLRQTHPATIRSAASGSRSRRAPRPRPRLAGCPTRSRGSRRARRPSGPTEQRQELAAYLPGRGRSTDSSPRCRRRQLVYAGASDFAPDGSHKPPGRPRPVHVLRRGDIHQPGARRRPARSRASPGLPARFDRPTRRRRARAAPRWRDGSPTRRTR